MKEWLDFWAMNKNLKHFLEELFGVLFWVWLLFVVFFSNHWISQYFEIWVSFLSLHAFFHSPVHFLHGQVIFLPAIGSHWPCQAHLLLFHHSKSFGHILMVSWLQLSYLSNLSYLWKWLVSKGLLRNPLLSVKTYPWLSVVFWDQIWPNLVDHWSILPPACLP